MAQLPNTYAPRRTPTFGGRTMVTDPVDTGETALGKSVVGFGQAVIKEEILNAKTEATHQVNQLEAEIIQNRTSEENGWENRINHGLGADFMKEETDRLNQSIEKFGIDLKDPYAKEVYERRTAVIRNRVAGNLAGHAMKEKKIARQLTQEGLVRTEIEKVAINYDNQDEIKASILNVNKSTGEYLDSLRITGPKRKEIMQQNVSALHRAVIVAAVDDDQYGLAQNYLDNLEGDDGLLKEGVLTAEDAAHVKKILKTAGIETASQELVATAYELYPGLDQQADRIKHIEDNSTSFLETNALAREHRRTLKLEKISQKGDTRKSQAAVKKVFGLYPDPDQQLDRREWIDANVPSEYRDSVKAREKGETALRKGVTKEGEIEKSQDVVERSFELYPGPENSLPRQEYIKKELSGAVEDNAIQREALQTASNKQARIATWDRFNNEVLTAYEDGIASNLKPMEAWEAIGPSSIEGMSPAARSNMRKRVQIETNNATVVTEYDAWFELFDLITGDQKARDKFRGIKLGPEYSGRVSTEHLIYFAKLQKSEEELNIASTIADIKQATSTIVLGKIKTNKKGEEYFALIRRIDDEMVADQIRTGKEKAGAFEAQIAADRVAIEVIQKRTANPYTAARGVERYNVTGDITEYAGRMEIKGIPTHFIDELALAVKKRGDGEVTEASIIDAWDTLAYAVSGAGMEVTEENMMDLYYHREGRLPESPARPAQEGPTSKTNRSRGSFGRTPSTQGE